MLSLLEMYMFTILGAAVFGAALALTGCHLTGRDRSMQTLCVSQGAMLGVIIGLALEQLHGHGTTDGSHLHAEPFIAAFITSGLVFLGGEAMTSKRTASKNTRFTALFALLLAAGYLISALIPALENHMTQRFFGDLVTLGPTESITTLILGVALLVFHWIYNRKLAADSFNLAIVGEANLSAAPNWTPILFNLVTLAAVCFGVQFLGLLFTVACMFVPTTILSLTRTRRLQLHLWLCAVVATVGCIVGFSLSLSMTRLPTTPTIVLMGAGLAWAILSIERRIQLRQI